MVSYCLNLKRKFKINHLYIKLSNMDKSNTNQYSGLFFKVGLVVSMGFALVAFEWETPTDNQLKVEYKKETRIYEDTQIPPITEQKISKPKPKTMQKPIEQLDKIEIVKNTANDTKVIVKEFNIDDEVVDPVIEIIEVIEPKEKVETIFKIVEESAMPKGGMSEFYKYVKKNLDYPRQAKRMGIEGKVFLEFIVNKDGSIVNAKVIRGIGGGCDEEALRIIQDSPKWNPGKQRGKAVRQRMTFPLNFQLN
jgi:protein TonB